MRNIKLILVAAAVLAIVVAPQAARAGAIVTSFTAFQSAVGSAAIVTTGTTGLYTVDPATGGLATTNVIPLSDGTSLNLANGDQIQEPANTTGGGYPFQVSGGYSGDLFSPPLTSETITITNGQSAFGFYVLPNSDNALRASSMITATLSNGTTTSFMLANGDLNTGFATPAFIGFVGGGETSITISTSDANGFAFGDFVEVPEPASAALLLAGVVFTGLRSRGRRPSA